LKTFSNRLRNQTPTRRKGQSLWSWGNAYHSPRQPSQSDRISKTTFRWTPRNPKIVNGEGQSLGNLGSAYFSLSATIPKRRSSITNNFEAIAREIKRP
jgi:hypothetical protein